MSSCTIAGWDGDPGSICVTQSNAGAVIFGVIRVFFLSIILATPRNHLQLRSTHTAAPRYDIFVEATAESRCLV